MQNKEMTPLELAGCIVLTALVIWGCWMFWVAETHTDRQEESILKGKGWRWTVEECEDYSDIQCDTKSKRDCSGFGDDRKCRTVYYTDCYRVTRTRVLNTWVREGTQDKTPAWPEYSIRKGYYKRAYQMFWLHLVTVDNIYPWNVNEADYYRYNLGDKFTLSFNWFGRIIRRDYVNER